jgi:hypothetical protein
MNNTARSQTMFLKISNNNKQILNSGNDGHKDDDNDGSSSSSSSDNNKMALYHTINKKPVNFSSNGETALSILE